MYNSNFDPLQAKNAGSEEVVIKNACERSGQQY